MSSTEKRPSISSSYFRQLGILADKGVLGLSIVRQGHFNRLLLESGLEFCDTVMSGVVPDSARMTNLSGFVATLAEEKARVHGIAIEEVSSDARQVRGVLWELLEFEHGDVAPIEHTQQTLARLALLFYSADRDSLAGGEPDGRSNGHT